MFANIVFCQKCGSENVYLNNWEDPITAKIVCVECRSEGEIRGFSLGRSWNVDKATINDAKQDMAIYKPWERVS